MNTQKTSDECCPKFNPAPWDNKMLKFKDKLFIKDNVFTLFFMPINFGSVITRMMKKVTDTGASTPDNMCLSDRTTLFNMNIFLAVDRKIPGAKNVTISGNFYSKVYEGDFSKTGEWCKDFESIVKEKGRTVKKWYMWYTTCPKCAKKYGKNYVVIFGEL
jgi:hypothetical protein